jgi:thiamine kinase-like enzyme
VDDIWERSIPFFTLTPAELAAIFHQYDASLELLSWQPVLNGCRNSHYIVETGRGRYFLRLFPPSDRSYLNEAAVNHLLRSQVAAPELYYVAQFQKRGCLIYEFIDAVSLQSRFRDKLRLDNEIIRQVAHQAAAIHNFKAADFRGLTPLDLPPFNTWFESFLSNTQAASRLGPTTVQKVRRLIKDKAAQLAEIDRYQTFIHSDFRPANMLIDDQNRVYIVDWEFPGNGHSLADIGQFFRYRDSFDQEHLSVFESEYNRRALAPLPDDWSGLSRLRDLVNPLQMIGAGQELPLKYHDLNNLILATLEFFGY